MTVIWTEKAYDDLDGIVDYLADVSPKSGERQHWQGTEGGPHAG